MAEMSEKFREIGSELCVGAGGRLTIDRNRCDLHCQSHASGLRYLQRRSLMGVHGLSGAQRARFRAAKRAQGLRLKQIWVPDLRDPKVREQFRREVPRSTAVMMRRCEAFLNPRETSGQMSRLYRGP
jgi:hypothetical protein